jgi:alpha-tubulin suppressor-like RCC1 family protein
MQAPTEQAADAELTWDLLPIEMIEIIFSYLTLRELLFFSLCSKLSAATVLANLKDQRKELLKHISLAANEKTIVYYTKDTLFAFGRNMFGELGFGDKSERQEFEMVPLNIRGVIKNVYLQSERIFLLTDQALYACGNGIEHLVGLDQSRSNRFNEVLMDENCGQIKQISVGDDHLIMLTESKVYRWGDNRYGQLFGSRLPYMPTLTQFFIPERIGEILQVHAAGQATLLLTSKGLFVCGDSASLGLKSRERIDKLTQVPLEKDVDTIQRVFPGFRRTFLLTDRGDLYRTEKMVGLPGLGDNKFFVAFIKIPLEDSMGEIKEVVLGSNHTLLLTENGLYGMGPCSEGQLGPIYNLGNKNNITAFTKLIMPEKKGKILNACAGGNFTFLSTKKDFYFSGVRPNDEAWKRISHKFVKAEEVFGHIYPPLDRCIYSLEKILKSINKKDEGFFQIIKHIRELSDKINPKQSVRSVVGFLSGITKESRMKKKNKKSNSNESNSPSEFKRGRF